MKKLDFESFMYNLQSERGGTGLTFAPKTQFSFQSALFNTSKYTVIGLVSDLYDTLIYDRRGAPYFLPKFHEDRIVLEYIPKNTMSFVSIRKTNSQEVVAYGLSEMFPGELMAILLWSGPVSQQLDTQCHRAW